MTNIEATLDQLYGLIASVRDNGAYPAEGFVKDILTSFEKEIREVLASRILHSSGETNDTDEQEIA